MPHTNNPSLKPKAMSGKRAYDLLCEPSKAAIRGGGNPPNGFKTGKGYPDGVFFRRKNELPNPCGRTIRAGKK